jgi:imidazolonepropionase-like amidohydrolase
MRTPRTKRLALAVVLTSSSFVVASCGGARGARSSLPRPEPDPPRPALPWLAARPTMPEIDSPLIAIVGGTVMTATGLVIDDGVVVLEDGRIRAVGARSEVAVPDGAQTIDARGRFVTPGLIDTHSHMGVYPVPSVGAHDDGNEATSPTTPQVRASDSFWPQDPSLPRALAAGITTIQVLPGSANLIGGAGEIYKMHLGRSSTEMELPGAPDTMKMACGENPKRVYGEQHQAPSTRMGNVAGYREAFQGAAEYGRAWRDWQESHRLWAIRHERWSAWQETQLGEGEAEGASDVPGAGGEGSGDSPGTPEEHPEDPGPAPAPPARDFGKELLLGAIEGRVLVQMHCYRADEMVRMIEISHEFGFRIRAFHHAVEAYKIRDLLAAEEISISTWADWWGFKLEAFDAIPENLALLTEAGVRAVMHSDSPMLVQRLNQEAAKAMTAGRNAGIDIDEDDALRWVTIHAAWTLGIDALTGSLEVGKMADVVVWSGSPFSVYSRPDLVFVDGALEHDRARDHEPHDSDFELGLDLEPAITEPSITEPSSAAPAAGAAR